LLDVVVVVVLVQLVVEELQLAGRRILYIAWRRYLLHGLHLGHNLEGWAQLHAHGVYQMVLLEQQQRLAVDLLLDEVVHVVLTPRQFPDEVAHLLHTPAAYGRAI